MYLRRTVLCISSLEYTGRPQQRSNAGRQREGKKARKWKKITLVDGGRKQGRPLVRQRDEGGVEQDLEPQAELNVAQPPLFWPHEARHTQRLGERCLRPRLLPLD